MTPNTSSGAASFKRHVVSFVRTWRIDSIWLELGRRGGGIPAAEDAPLPYIVSEMMQWKDGSPCRDEVAVIAVAG